MDSQFSANVLRVLDPDNYRQWGKRFTHHSPEMLNDVAQAIQYFTGINDPDLEILLAYIDAYAKYYGFENNTRNELELLNESLLYVAGMPRFKTATEEAAKVVYAYIKAVGHLHKYSGIFDLFEAHVQVINDLLIYITGNTVLFEVNGYAFTAYEIVLAYGRLASSLLENEQRFSFAANIILNHSEIITLIKAYAISETGLWHGWRTRFVGGALYSLGHLSVLGTDNWQAGADQAMKDIVDYYRDGNHAADIELKLKKWGLMYQQVGRESECSTTFLDYCGGLRSAEQLFSSRYYCNNQIKITAQVLSVEQARWVCAKLTQLRIKFHDMMQTNRLAVNGDNNSLLEVIIFESYDSYKHYAVKLYHASSNSGGTYIEGNPAKNNAKFIAHISTWNFAVDFSIWGLEHEYTHYLDGRFVRYGGAGYFTDVNWWIEGLAEFMNWGGFNGFAYQLATNTAVEDWPDLADVFAVGYGSSNSSLYYHWGYFAVRFLFEKHHADFMAIVDALKMSDGQGVYNYLITMIENNYNSEFHAWVADELLVRTSY